MRILQSNLNLHMTTSLTRGITQKSPDGDPIAVEVPFRPKTTPIVIDLGALAQAPSMLQRNDDLADWYYNSKSHTKTDVLFSPHGVTDYLACLACLAGICLFSCLGKGRVNLSKLIQVFVSFIQITVSQMISRTYTA